jgi:hypothetical protein
LVEFQNIQEIIQLSVLSSFLELNVVLLKTMEGKLCLVIDENFERLMKFVTEAEFRTKP